MIFLWAKWIAQKVVSLSHLDVLMPKKAASPKERTHRGRSYGSTARGRSFEGVARSHPEKVLPKWKNFLLRTVASARKND